MIKTAQVAEMMKLAAENLRALSEENQNVKSERDELQEKLAHYEKKEKAESIAKAMEEKGLEPGVSYEEKVAGLMARDRLDVVEEAVGMSAPQSKLASVHEDNRVSTDGGGYHDDAADRFAASLASLG